MASDNLFTQEAAEWATTILVVICGAAAGHYASEGMNVLQWAGAVTAVLGSVTAAVAVRVWRPVASKIED